MTYDIITIGSATRDVLMSAKDFHILDSHDFIAGKGLCVPLGGKLHIHDIAFTSGGGGTNAAVTFARQGLHTACIGMIGDDAHGRDILDELRRERVDTKYMQLHRGATTAYSVIFVVPTGERTILAYGGDGLAWNDDALSWDRLLAPWMYVNSLNGDVKMLQRIVDEASAVGRHLATNPGGKDIALGLSVLAPFWKKFDIVGVNQEEGAQLTGIPFDREAEIFHALDEAIGGICIMTKGGKGVSVSDGHFIYSAGVPASKIVERTGAGDAFHAGFTAEFIRSGSIERAIQMGTANATSVVSYFGAKQGILRRNEHGSAELVRVTKKLLAS